MTVRSHIIENERSHVKCFPNGFLLDKLTAYAAYDLIKAIYIGAPGKGIDKRRQSISICYDSEQRKSCAAKDKEVAPPLKLITN